MKIINKIIVLSIISSNIILGASLPNVNSGTIERQIQAPKIPFEQKQNVQIEGLQSDNLKSDISNKKIFIKDFSFVGNKAISSEELKNSINSYSNKELTYNQIQEVLSIVTKIYRDKGYFVARAYLEKQDLLKNDNVLKITIMTGSYGKFKLSNNSLANSDVLQKILDDTKAENIISSEKIERALLLINNRAGVKVFRAEISPGEEVGSSDFRIETSPTKKVDGYVVADNYGSRYTGYNRLQALANINSPFNIGDKLTVSGLVSNGTDLKNGKLAYETPLLSNGLKANFAYSRTNYNLVKEYKALDADGNSNIYEVGLSYPVVLKNDESLYAKIKYYHKDFNDYMDNVKYEDKTVNSIVASLDYTKNYFLGEFPSRLFSNINLTSGHLSNSSNVDDGRYNKIDAYVSNEIAFSEIFSFNQTLTAQKVLGHKNLDGSEDISLGGAYGVRLYPDSEQSGENGYVLNFELLSKLPNISSYYHKVGLFYDIGDVYAEKNQDTTFERKRLKDIGLGYYANYEDFFVRAQIAWNANSDEVQSEDSSHKNSKLLLQAGWVF
ncbi:ShlB/FhaC/HecB family hemolysin secretion/activation protein [Aliarcobacter butzleri]|uniref:ShlB/FhaC/HecB family hemolysin secretion/activation protein n=1 Tax=Aliarcobacter butzleri TaxID=28197 RepID=A0AAW7PNB7_9BACT|nr:ShlB/FhaC/HecB family hemolysin secretion/activation protein [Aliarcobacter butzleri]MDN5062812.1 ShlB/FhaC/HecB family hemolysin secretion/activation protein [Aliarcobacter butzleri]MDN5066903.1 ShlB/FhaC/HecB family hemolysin secretion/activation protein [Aliarcobacter butzleri]